MWAWCVTRSGGLVGESIASSENVDFGDLAACLFSPAGDSLSSRALMLSS